MQGHNDKRSNEKAAQDEESESDAEEEHRLSEIKHPGQNGKLITIT